MSMTAGMMRAIGKIAANRKPCAECGFPLPKYPGRYPSKCPNCSCALGESEDDDEDEPDDEEEDDEEEDDEEEDDEEEDDEEEDDEEEDED